MPGLIRIGTQGWNYPDWAGVFFPEGARPADYLSLYARAFSSVEVDATFYAVPAERTLHGWTERTPEGFVFALKLPREITHERRLVGAEPVLEEFLDRAEELDRWADALRPLPDRGLDVYGYFSNHFAGHAPANARELQERLGQRPVPPERIGEQTRLF